MVTAAEGALSEAAAQTMLTDGNVEAYRGGKARFDGRNAVKPVLSTESHGHEADRPIEEVTEALAGLVRAGKIGAFGFSEIAPASLRRAAAVHPVAAVQAEYSLGTALVAFSQVGNGLLCDTPPDGKRAEAFAFLKNNPRFVEPNLAANIAATDRLRRLAADMGTAAVTLSMAWLLHRSPSVIPIPGTRNTAHLEELRRVRPSRSMPRSWLVSRRRYPSAGRTVIAATMRSGTDQIATAEIGRRA